MDCDRGPNSSVGASPVRNGGGCNPNTDQIRLVLRANESETWSRNPTVVESHTRRLPDALRSAVDGGDVAPLVRLWEYHVLGAMAAPQVLDPR